MNVMAGLLAGLMLATWQGKRSRGAEDSGRSWEDCLARLISSSLTEESDLERILGSPLTGRKLAGLKTCALGRGVWYRVLDRVERGLLDPTMRWVDNVAADGSGDVVADSGEARAGNATGYGPSPNGWYRPSLEG